MACIQATLPGEAKMTDLSEGTLNYPDFTIPAMDFGKRTVLEILALNAAID